MPHCSENTGIINHNFKKNYYDGGNAITNGDYDQTSWKAFAIGLKSSTLVYYLRKKKQVTSQQYSGSGRQKLFRISAKKRETVKIKDIIQPWINGMQIH